MRILSTLALAVALTSAPAAPAAERPSFVVFIADDVS